MRAFAGTTGPVFQAAGRPQIIVYISGLYTFVFVGALVLLVPPFGIIGAATALMVTAAIPFVLSLWAALRILELPLREFLSNLARPALCTVPLAAVLASLELSTQTLQTTLQLLLLVASGLIAYSASLVVFGRSELRMITAAFRH